MPKRLWEIRGYDSTTEIFKSHVPVSCFGERRIQELLKALAAKAGLTFDEIVGAYARKNATLANDLLVVRKDGPYPQYTCGSNPHFIAKIVERE